MHILFPDFSTFIRHWQGSNTLSASTFWTKNGAVCTQPNPFIARLYAPNVGTSSHLFVPNKKSIRGCDAIMPKMLRIYCHSALGIAETTSSLRSSPLPTTWVGPLLHYVTFPNAFAFYNYTPFAPAGCSDKFVLISRKCERIFSCSSTKSYQNLTNNIPILLFNIGYKIIP